MLVVSSKKKSQLDAITSHKQLCIINYKSGALNGQASKMNSYFWPNRKPNLHVSL